MKRFHFSDIKIGWYIVVLIILWRLLISLTSWWTIENMAFEPTFPYADQLVNRYGDRLLTTWAHFDGVHYLTIVERGYVGTGLIQAFFPFYPILVWLFSIQGLLNPVVIGSLVSTVCLTLALYFLYLLMRLDGESDATSKQVLLFNLAFVTAFFFTSVYGESLFLLLSVLSIYLVRKKHWAWAGIVGILAAFTRLTGVFLILMFLYEWRKEYKQFNAQLLYCIFPVLGLLMYMGYLQMEFGNPLLFASVQSSFGADRQVTELTTIVQVFYRYANMLVTVSRDSLLYYQVLLELGSAIFAFVSLIVGWFWVRKSYVIYAAASFMLPTLTGTFSSIPRYILVLFPLFVVSAKIKSKTIRLILFCVFVGLQLVNVILFTQGKWIA